MPRPRVPEKDRQRAVRACRQCRASKKRCNGHQPCPNCIRKGIAGECVFTDNMPNTSNQRNHRYTPALSMSSRDDPRIMQDPYEATAPSLQGSNRHSSPEALHQTHPRLLSSSRGDKVFVGGSASLAFLQLIREVVSQSLGNSKLSQYPERDHMLEAPQHAVRPIAKIPLSHEKQRQYVELAYTACQGLIEFWTSEWVMETIDHGCDTSDTRSQFILAVAHLVLAIGAQCAATDEATTSVAESYFADAQELVFSAHLRFQCLASVQAFLLMTFYMMGACQRNAAYMYVGVAARAAFVLGLHCDTYPCQDTTKGDSAHIGELTWKSLVTLDVMVSSILGRPAAISTRHVRASIQTHSGPDSHHALDANFRLACLIDQKVQKLYLTEKVTAETARACLDQLRNWSASLPDSLRQMSSSTLDCDGLNTKIGGLHVSCAYYFGVMQISRPFLILRLTNRLARGLRPQHLPSSDTGHENLGEIGEIAAACINAAIFMVQTCLELRNRNILPKDMRILKAWVFAAGLVLGFDMFTTAQSEPETEKAFQGSCELMQMFSERSVQAAHYHDILLSLSEAISSRRQQMSTKTSNSKEAIVERIMAFGPQENIQEGASGSTTNGQNPPPMNLSDVGGSDGIDWAQDFAADFNFEAMMNEPFLNWASTDFIEW